jgi:hypothetical protein
LPNNRLLSGNPLASNYSQAILRAPFKCEGTLVLLTNMRYTGSPHVGGRSPEAITASLENFVRDATRRGILRVKRC